MLGFSGSLLFNVLSLRQITVTRGDAKDFCLSSVLVLRLVVEAGRWVPSAGFSRGMYGETYFFLTKAKSR
jgi:hypothetical protein